MAFIPIQLIPADRGYVLVDPAERPEDGEDDTVYAVVAWALMRDHSRQNEPNYMAPVVNQRTGVGLTEAGPDWEDGGPLTQVRYDEELYAQAQAAGGELFLAGGTFSRESIFGPIEPIR